MADEKYLEVLQLGKDAWNIWYNPKYRGVADLKGVAPPCADLSAINLSGAMLQNADLRYANLTGADLRGADLSGARLERAILHRTNLENVRGLTSGQLHHAEGDVATQLPRGLKAPHHWLNTDGGQFAIPEPAPLV